MVVNAEDKLLKSWCTEQDIDFQLAQKLKTQIFPLFENIHYNQLIPTFSRDFIEQREGPEIRLKNTMTILNLLIKLKLNTFEIKKMGNNTSYRISNTC